jgi:MarR family transcriptional regulator, organic hydroperoxide resistance regulator
MYVHIKKRLPKSKSLPTSGTVPSLAMPDERCCLSANLRKASRVISSLYADAMHGSALEGTQFTLLSSVSGFGEVSIGDLGEFMAMDQTTVTRNVQVLKKAGYLTSKGGEDRRKRMIYLTKKGRDVLTKTHPLWLKAQARVWEKLGEEQAKNLLELSQKIAALAD